MTLIEKSERSDEIARFDRAVSSGVTAALVSDALDVHGYPRQSLGPEIRASESSVVVGRAFTVGVESVDTAPTVPYVGLLQALDALQTGDVYVISTRGDRTTALWGELLSTAALASGAVGAVCDGYVRDTAKVRAIGFPVFARGSVPSDINGRYEVTAQAVPLTINDVAISPGDVIVGDGDGVVVVPAALVDAVLEAAQTKALAENGFRNAVRNGTKPSDAFAKFGVL